MRCDILYIRVIATLLVVLGHSEFYDGFSGFRSEMIPGINDNTIWNLLCRIIYSFHMALFFGISGALVAYSSEKKGVESFHFSVFLKKKINRLLFPFFVITFFYALPIKFITGRYEFANIENALYESVLTVDGTHTWFMLALFWCMLLGGGILLMEKKNFKIHPIIIVVLFFHIVGIPTFVPEFLKWFCIPKFLRFVVFFIMGYYLEKYKKSVYLQKLITIPLVFPILVFIIVEILYIDGSMPHGGFWGPKLNQFVQDIIGFLALLLSYNITTLIKIQHTGKIIKFLDKHSYEIYLYSEPINYFILFYCVCVGGWYWGDGFLFWTRFFITLFGAIIISLIVRFNFGQK